MEGLRRNRMTKKREPGPSCDNDGIVVLRIVARAVTPLVMLLLLAGLSAAISTRVVTDPEAAVAVTTLPMHELAAPGQFVTPLGVLTAGLLLLATAPTLTVLLVTLAHGRSCRWREAVMAAGVLAILTMSAAFMPH